MKKLGIFLDNIIACLGYAGAAAGAISIISMILIINLNVFLRQFFNKPLFFVEEYSGYFLVVLVYMGLAFTAREGGHINVDIVVRRLSKRTRDGLEIGTLAVSIATMGVYFWFAWDLFMESLRVGARAITIMSTPLWIPRSFLWIGLSFLILEIVALIVKKFIDFRRGII
jgi:TRAP-type C4-dicarboxylate transport system permease small subunit